MRLKRTLELQFWDEAPTGQQRTDRRAQEPMIGSIAACLPLPTVSHPFRVPLLGEMGFEPLKPVGEPDAANSRIRFDVRLGGSFAAIVRCTVSRWRSSAGCECGQGRGPPLGELQDIVGEADEAPLVGDLLDAAQEKPDTCLICPNTGSGSCFLKR